MAQSDFERTGGTYHREGDYLIPDLVAPPAPKIGIWGMRRKHYLQQYHDGIYTGMLLSGKLNSHLEEIDQAAENMFFQLVDQMAASEGITEQLKVRDQMLWVQRMNCIRDIATEVVNHDLKIFDFRIEHRTAGSNPRRLHYYQVCGHYDTTADL